MYIWSNNGFIYSPPTSRGSAIYLERTQRPSSHTRSQSFSDQLIKVSPPDMFRKASNLFSSSTNSPKQPSPVDDTSTTHGLKKPTKKRSLADILSRAPSSGSGGSINYSSLSTSSIDTYASASYSKTKDLGSKLSKPRLRARKRSLPKWEARQEMEDRTPVTGIFKVPYLQGYSAMSMENDYQTSELLKQFYPSTCPVFHQFPAGQVPQNILDLGCGRRGTWVIEAATHWRAHGTKVTGFDLREPETRSIDSSICNNVRFVEGNFLMKLPFEDNSFDLVRMANLNLCIPQARWQIVLQEAHRVLRPGGILEVIDEEMLWPYLKSLPTSPVGLTSSRPSALQEDSDGEGEAQQRCTTLRSGPPTRSDAYEEYDRNVSLSKAMEGLFEKMIWSKHGIHSRPHEFVQGYISKVFGEYVPHESGPFPPRVFKVALPPAGFELHEKEVKEDKNGFGSLFTIEWEKKKGDNRSTETSIGSDHGRPVSLPETITSKAARRLLGSTVPTRLGDKRDITGLVLYPEKSYTKDASRYPDKFAMMDPAQMETSICRNMHVLLSCKKALTEYICELEGGEDEMLKEEISSAFWDYECFRRTRFNLPHTLNELKMKEDSAENTGFRLSTDSADSGYSSSSSQSRSELHGKHSKSSVNINLQESQDLTWVRVIHVFNGTKSKGAN